MSDKVAARGAARLREHFDFYAPTLAPHVEFCGAKRVFRAQSLAPLALVVYRRAVANEALVKSVKDIAALSKAGDLEGAYHGYRDLFASEAFAGYRVEDQRQALRLMTLAKGLPAQPTPAMKEAYLSAATCLTRLLPLGDAADHEMLGVCQVMLGDEASASTTFRAGLAIERLRDPQSKLCGTLMKRVSMV